MNKKVATASTATSTAADVVVWNEKWLRRLSAVVSYPCVGVIGVSFTLGIGCRDAWFTLPGVAMILYGIVYLNFIRYRTSSAWKNWVSRNRRSNDLPRGLWRVHSNIHVIFIKHQQAFLWGTCVLSFVSYVGAFLFCECTYPGITDLREVSPAAAIFRMLLWSIIAAIMSLWISYIITHQKWVRDDAWDEVKQEI